MGGYALAKKDTAGDLVYKLVNVTFDVDQNICAGIPEGVGEG